MREVEITDARGNKSLHMIYELSEAIELGRDYLGDWRNGTEGSWVKTDDEMVIQILKVGKASGQRYMKTCIGTYVVGSTRKMDTSHREDRNTFSGKRSGSGGRVSPRLALVLKKIVLGMHPVDAYMSIYSEAKKESASARISALMRTKEVKDFMEKETGDVMERLGMDKEWILSSYKALIDAEETNENAKVSALKSVAEMAGMFSKNKSDRPTNLFLGLSREEMGAIEKESSHKEVVGEVVKEEPRGDDEGGDGGSDKRPLSSGEDVHILDPFREESDAESGQEVDAKEGPF